MDAILAELADSVPASSLLGYLNFSDGRPDPRWQRHLDDAHAFLTANGVTEAWPALRDWLLGQLDALAAGGSAAFRVTDQARAALGLVFDHLLPAYRRHHSDLLAHATDADLFTPFFVARAFEAALAEGGPWGETERIVAGAMQRLNDYVGYRPIAVLEGRPQTDLYPHEKFRPVPIYLRGAGPAKGKYHAMVAQALDILRATDADLRAEAGFDLEQLDELAVDPRAYDHGHPANRRPNYAFGEWDPHQIDNRGRYRRFVARQVTLDAALNYRSANGDGRFEAAAVLAGTVLMASGISGGGPGFHDSAVTLSKLVPRIARYRDLFYTRLLETVPGELGERLRAESVRLRQPFGGCRQALNQEMSRQRAEQLQESRLAVLFAEMGYPEESRRRAAGIATASARILAEVRIRLSSARLATERGDLSGAADLLVECEGLIHRGIECGALADPWSALGFQGLYPLFQSREDSVHDPRLDDLLGAMSRLFHCHALLLAAAGSAGDPSFRQALTRRLERLATWWDRHATYEVGDLERVHGGERAAAARHVAQALAGWRARLESGEGSAGDLAYWRQQREGFRSPAAFAQVVEALLRQGDLRAAMALLMAWLAEAGTVALDEGEASLHTLAKRWLAAATAGEATPERLALVVRFFEHLEANADDLWEVPLIARPTPREEGDADERFAAAYEGMKFRDSADDGEEGAVAGGGGPAAGFALEEEADRLEDRLEFLTATAKLWLTAADFLRPAAADANVGEALGGWRASAEARQAPLLELLDALHALAVPEPVGGFEDVMEYDRRRYMKDRLIEKVIETSLETGRAARRLGAVLGVAAADPAVAAWEAAALPLEAAIGRADPAAVRARLGAFLAEFRREPLLFVPLSANGDPRQILRVRRTQAMLQSLLRELPRLGLVRETFHLVKLAKTMEEHSPVAGRRVSEFDRLFPVAVQASLEALLDGATTWPATLADETALVELLRRVTDSFLGLWLAHSQTLRLSVLESVVTGKDWEALREFVVRYGSDLFTPQFLSLASLRAVLHRGLGNWLDTQAEADDPPRLVRDLERNRIRREQAVAHLECVVSAVAENHEEYRDYNTTTTQSDYGENLHLLLEFLRLKSNYERYAWRMRPLVMAHAVLCRRGRDGAALKWQEGMASFTRKLADQMLEELAKLEQERGLRLRSVRDRLEERFVQPLVIDRLCAAAGPALRAASESDGGEALGRLQAQLRPLTQKPVGVGLEVPAWLRRFEEEVERAREAQATAERPAPGLAPGVSLSRADLQRQLDDWDKALDGAGP